VQKEKALPADRRVDFVSVATPNHTHFEIAKAAVDAGFNVMCDKPMTFDPGRRRRRWPRRSIGRASCSRSRTTTRGYPLVRQAREMILGGELGEINAIRSNYIQGWLADAAGEGFAEAGCVAGPIRARAGPLAASATSPRTPINLARYTTGLLPAEISCHLKTFEPGRQLDDYGTAVIRFQNGGAGQP